MEFLRPFADRRRSTRDPVSAPAVRLHLPKNDQVANKYQKFNRLVNSFHVVHVKEREFVKEASSRKPF